MTGKTHKLGGMFCSVVGFALLKQKGLLVDDINVGLQWLVMYPFTYWGSTASDLDHHWDSCPSKDLPSRAVHAVLHIGAPVQKFCDKHFKPKTNKHNPIYIVASLLNAKHRSWQTHSDLTLAVLLLILHKILSGEPTALRGADTAIVQMVMMGITMGVLEHFILDSLTPDGINLVLCQVINKLIGAKLPAKLRLVPKSSFFATDSLWEEFVCNVLRVLTVLSILWLIGTVIFPIVIDAIPFDISLGG